VQIDGVTGEAFPHRRVTFPAGSPTDFKGLDFSPGGTLYVGSADGRIYTIDTSSGIATLAATSSIPISGLAFEPSTGALWASPRTSPVFRDRVYRISLPAGDTLGVGNTGFTQTLSDLAFDPAGNLYGLVGNPASSINYRLARVDKGTGVGTEIGSLGLNGMVGIAFSPTGGATAVEGRPAGQVPKSIELEQNYPNPFNGSTSIVYQVSGVRSQASGARSQSSVASRVKLGIYDILGREVAVLVDEDKAPGRYVVHFDASGLASGVYLYRLIAGPNMVVREMVLAR
jgi:hypothetical protein